MSQMMNGMMGGPMRQHADDDPEMAKLAVAEAELAQASDDVLSQYAAADKPEDQKRLKAELRDALAKQFDVQRQERELELARVEERIKKVRDQLNKRNAAREWIVDRRLDQLINAVDGLGWTAPAGASPRGAGSDQYRNDFQNRPAATPALRKQ
jgi:flagellar motility protein MotE (MotC chaperone)